MDEMQMDKKIFSFEIDYLEVYDDDKQYEQVVEDPLNQEKDWRYKGNNFSVW